MLARQRAVRRLRVAPPPAGSGRRRAPLRGARDRHGGQRGRLAREPHLDDRGRRRRTAASRASLPPPPTPGSTRPRRRTTRAATRCSRSCPRGLSTTSGRPSVSRIRPRLRAAPSSRPRFACTRARRGRAARSRCCDSRAAGPSPASPGATSRRRRVRPPPRAPGTGYRAWDVTAQVRAMYEAGRQPRLPRPRRGRERRRRAAVLQPGEGREPAAAGHHVRSTVVRRRHDCARHHDRHEAAEPHSRYHCLVRLRRRRGGSHVRVLVGRCLVRGLHLAGRPMPGWRPARTRSASAPWTPPGIATTRRRSTRGPWTTCRPRRDHRA